MTIKKKIMLFLITLAFGLVTSFYRPTKVSAHSLDYFDGYSTGLGTYNPSQLRFKVHNNAITSIITQSDYRTISEWNGISSNINVGVAFEVPGMPETGFNSIYGYTFPEMPDALGVTIAFDRYGNVTSLDSGVSSVGIRINILPNAFSGATDVTNAVRKTIKHEVGHALMLSHPADANVSGHLWRASYGMYLPIAIMNQGYPNGSFVPYNISTHDINNLIAKWGA